MRIMQNTNKEAVKLSLSRDELLVLHQALNEVLNGLDIPELPTRMGAEHEEIAVLMERLGEAIGNA